MIEEQRIYYIGDISKNDALVLKEMAETHENILEFGSGASTQILAKYSIGKVNSVDTEQTWIDKTINNLKLLNIDGAFFELYSNFIKRLEQLESSIERRRTIDFVFDDGVDHLRREFAIKIWPYLKVGGILAFHDTRRAPDFRNVLEVLAHFQDEIGKVEFNYKGSNITLVHKKEKASYSNWQIDEGKNLPETLWMLGYNEPPQDFIDKMKSIQNAKV